MRAAIVISALAALTGLAGCDGTGPDGYPALLPQAQILVAPSPEATAPDALAARAEALRRKAAGLRGPIAPGG